MPIRPNEFDLAAQSIKPMLDGLPPRIIAVTGPMGAGKTTFARFLAWYFNVSLVESDHYLRPHQGSLSYEPSEVARIVTYRLSMPRPVIVEGAGVLKLLAEIQRTPDFIFHVRNRAAQRRRSTPVKVRDPKQWGYEACPCYELVVEHDAG